jgi:PAS domain S-box-containing protein
MKRVKLHTRFLILLSSISLIPILLTAFPTYFRFQRTLEGDAIRLQSQLAARAAAELNSFIVSNIRVLETVGALYNPEFPVNYIEANQTVQNTLFRNDNFEDISIVDRDGKEIIRQHRIHVINRADLKDIHESEAFKTVREKGVYVGPLHIEAVKPLFTLGRRLTDARGDFFGAVFAEVDAQIMPKIMMNISEIAGENGLAYMVDRNGVIVAHPDLSLILLEKDISSTPIVKSLRSSLNDAPVSERYYNDKNEHILGSAYHIAFESFDLKLTEPFKTDWYIIIEQHYSSILVEADRSAVFAVILSILVMISVVIAAFFLSKKISSPIESLSNVALEFGRGNLDYRTPISSNDEIGDLAKSFNKMAETISNSIIRLREEEQIISAERDKLSIILSGITNAVIAVDLERNVVLFNIAAEKLTGLKSGDVLGKSLANVIKLSDEDKLLSVDDFCPSKDRGDNFEGIVYQNNNLKLINHNGSERFVNIISGMIKEKSSIKLGCIITFQDITEEMLLNQAQKDFVAIASHEMRTPLTIIRGSTEHLLNDADLKNNSGLKDKMEAILKNVKHLLDIVNDFFLVQDLEKREGVLKLEIVNIKEVLDNIVADFSGSASERKIYIKLDSSVAKAPSVLLDKELFRQICTNLIQNGLNYTREGGVTISLEKSDDNIKIYFKDTGAGISPEDQANIFTKFKAGKTFFESTGYGSGLSLYLSKLLAQSMNSDVKLEKSEPGVGSIFSLSLPFTQK